MITSPYITYRGEAASTMNSLFYCKNNGAKDKVMDLLMLFCGFHRAGIATL
jgi:hypothetical protein